MKFPTPTEIIRGDQAEARTCNVDLPKSRINILGDKQNTLSRKAMLKRPIIRENHRKKPIGDHVSFDKKEAGPYPYPRILIVLMSMARVTILKVLVDTESALNILFNSTLKWT